MEIIKFEDYEEGVAALIDIESCPVPVRQDYWRRNDNIASGKKLCDECDGTGNQFMYMYSKCPACKGSGLTQRAPDLGQAVTNPNNDDVAPSG